MPRYFQSLGAGRPINIGGRSFIFEPTEPMGGSWSGVLAVDDESSASILADAGLEISFEQFESLKKKRTTTLTAQGYVPLQRPQSPPLPLEASVSPAESRSGSNSNATETVTILPSVELGTTTLKPPAEPALETTVEKRKR